MEKLYVFYIDSKGNTILERTVGAEWRAKERVTELKGYHQTVYYSTKLPEIYFY